MLTQMTQDIWSDTRSRYGTLALILAGLLGAGWAGFTWYKRSQEQTAYKDLALSIDGYSRVRNNPQAQGWVDVERGFQAGAQRNTSSKMYPYFLLYQADAISEQGKLKEAAVLMDQALKGLDQTNPIYHLYAIKRALIKVDSTDASLEKQGREELQALAKNASNPLQDMARYYAGVDMLDQGDAEGAKKLLESVAQSSGMWYQLAQDALRKA